MRKGVANQVLSLLLTPTSTSVQQWKDGPDVVVAVQCHASHTAHTPTYDHEDEEPGAVVGGAESYQEVDYRGKKDGAYRLPILWRHERKLATTSG